MRELTAPAERADGEASGESTLKSGKIAFRIISVAHDG